MRKRNKHYLVEIYKGTTFLRLFLFLSIGVLMVNSIGIPPIFMLLLGCVALLLLMFCLFMRINDVWLRVGFILLALSFGGIWSVEKTPYIPVNGLQKIEIISVQKGSGHHLACDALLLEDCLIRLNTDSSLQLNVGETIDADISPYWPKYLGGNFNYPLYLYRKGYSGAAWLDSAKIVARRQNIRASIPAWRQMCVERFKRVGISRENLGIVSAITIGEKSSLNEDVQANFRNAGVAHVLVVSGMHVGFIFLLINLLLKRAKQKSVVVLSGIAVIWAYALFVGMTPSVCRASLMFSVMLLCRLYGEEYNSMNALALSAVVLLAANPLVLYDIGFQLSFLAVFSIILFYPSFPSVTKGWLVQKLYNIIRLSFSAQILVFPVIVFYFGQLPLYFILSNVAIALLTPMIFVGGLLTLLPLIGDASGMLLDWLLTLFRLVVQYVAQLPYSTIELTFDSMTTIALLAMILMIGNILRSPALQRL